MRCARSLAGKFRTFGSGLVAWRRQSLLAIFQFPFRNARDRFDIEGDWLEGSNAMRGETKASGASMRMYRSPGPSRLAISCQTGRICMEGLLSWGRKTPDHRMAIFRQVNKERAAAHGREIASFPLVGGDRQPEADWHGKIKEDTQ